MSKIDGIPHIICITTNDSEVRLKNFENQCNKYGINKFIIHSFPRYDDSLFILNGPYVDKLHVNSKGPITSHISAIKRWYDTQSEDIVLVMEDDVNLDTIDYWNFNWLDFFKNLPKDWDCVQLCLIKEDLSNTKIDIHKRFNNDFGCQAYLLTRKYAKKIIDKYYVDDHTFNLDLNNIYTLTPSNKYELYDLFPIVENILFEGLGNVYNFPLFTEDVANTSSSFMDDINTTNDSYHTASYKFVMDWWVNTGKNTKLKNLNSKQYKEPINIVQIGSHCGGDDLSRYILSNYQSLKLGLFVEANPSHIETLKECYSRLENIQIENLAIKYFNDTSNKITIFYHDNDPDKQVASTDINHVKKHEIYWKPGGSIQSFETDALNLHELFDKYKLINIDWLLLDIEGMEPDIIMNLNFDKYKIQKIEFEALHLGDRKNQIIDKLNKLGYTQVNALHEYDIAFQLKESIFDQYAIDPENVDLNLKLAKYYYDIGHTASAFTHYLRAAERTENTDISYKCLIMGYKCFNQQKNRDFTSSHLLKHAISIDPKRPEAYFYLSKFYEEKKSWYDSYTYSSIGAECDDKDPIDLDDYPGKIGLLFNKAVSCYWWDKIDESRTLFNRILENYIDIPYHYLSLIEYNLTEIEKKRQVHKTYIKDYHHKLKFNFATSDTLEKNYSQAYQDLFCLIATNGKQNGTYLEIGAGDPLLGNNTYLLEKKYNWTGISVEINSDLANKFRDVRSNRIIGADATKLNYSKLLNDIIFTDHIDYLQLDCEPPNKTFEVLLSIPFHKYKFGVITYEHDYYLDMTKSYRDKSRNYLWSLGYKLILPNVSLDNSTPFEDWWVHPDIICSNTIEKLLIHNISQTHNIESYLFLN
jgi:hypothetical protein